MLDHDDDDNAGALTVAEVRRLKKIARIFPDDKSVSEAGEIFETYKALGRIGKIFLATLKILAVVSGGVLAWMHLRGLWFGKGGGQ